MNRASVIVIAFLNLIHSFETGFSTAINSYSFILSRLPPNSLRRVFDSSLGKLPCPLTQFINLSITLIGEERERDIARTFSWNYFTLLALHSSSCHSLDVRNQHETAVAAVAVSERLSSCSTSEVDRFPHLHISLIKPLFPCLSRSVVAATHSRGDEKQQSTS